MNNQRYQDLYFLERCKGFELSLTTDTRFTNAYCNDRAIRSNCSAAIYDRTLRMVNLFLNERVSMLLAIESPARDCPLIVHYIPFTVEDPVQNCQLIVLMERFFFHERLEMLMSQEVQI